jgi:hypothetical protein
MCVCLNKEFQEALSQCIALRAMQSVTVSRTEMFAEILLQNVVQDEWFCKKPVERCGTEPLVGRL